MKKSSILILIIICLFSCGKASKEVHITGEIKGLGTDTLYLYVMDESLDRIDTIFAEDDKFSYTLKIDTITSAYLLFHDETEYPLFLDKGNTIKIKGDASSLDVLTVEGNVYNEELTAFLSDIKGLGTPSESMIEQKVEDFIRQHHSSYTSIYLLDKYFVQKETPDFSKIKKLIEVMAGVLQDKPYIEQLNEYIDQTEKAEVGKYAPYFNLPNAKGEKINRSSEAFKQKNLLINFWASWNDSITGQQSNRELKDLYQKYKKNKYIGMLGISLDVDKEAWKNAIKRDTLSWEQVCDFGGLNAEIVKQYAIREVPTNILLSSDGKILARNLQGAELKKKIEEIVSEAEAKEKKDKKDNKKK